MCKSESYIIFDKKNNSVLHSKYIIHKKTPVNKWQIVIIYNYIKSPHVQNI